MAHNSHVQEHRHLTKKGFISALNSVYLALLHPFTTKLCLFAMRIFPPPVGLSLHNPDFLRISQCFINQVKHFCRMNSVIKRIFHCIKLTLIKDWTIYVSFSSCFSSIMKTILIQSLEI